MILENQLYLNLFIIIADGKSEDGNGGEEEEAMLDAGIGNRRESGEEGEGERGGDSEDGEIELGFGREGEAVVSGESAMAGPGRDQPGRRQLPSDQSRPPSPPRRRRPRPRPRTRRRPVQLRHVAHRRPPLLPEMCRRGLHGVGVAM